jgi:cytosine/adenosine deaminase-related metal-dependent hydrolase
MTARDGLRHAANFAAFGWEGGRLAAGAPADLVAVAKSSRGLTPANDWHRQLVYGSPALEVSYAVVAGEIVLDAGRIASFDESAVLAEARSIATALFA